MNNIAYIEMDETGVYVEGGGYAPKLVGNKVPVPDGLNPEALLRHYIVEGALVPRPEPPKPVAIEGGWRLSACPGGSQVFIYDVDGDEMIFEGSIETDGLDFDFSLPDVGSYIVEIDAPLPFTDTKTKIEVV